MTLRRATTSGPILVTGGSYNRMASATDFVDSHLRQLIRPGARIRTTTPAGTILAVADEALQLGTPVGLSGASFTDVADEGEFLIHNHMDVTATLVQATHWMDHWGLVAWPANDEYTETLVAVRGLVATTIQVVDTTAEFVDINTSNQLEALHYGAGKILWRESGTGSKLAKVLMGAGRSRVYGILLAGATFNASATLTLIKGGVQTASTLSVEHDRYPGDLNNDTYASAVWDPDDRLWHIEGASCP